MPVFCSSVALLRRSPYCSYRWHTRQTTHSYRQDKKTRRSALLAAIRFRPALRPVPSYRRGGAFFFIISSSYLSFHPHRFISSRSTCRMIAWRWASRSCASFFCLMPCRLISSDEGKQDNGAGFASPSYLIRVRAWAVYLAAIPSPSRSSSRASRVVERLASPRSVPGHLIR